MATHTAPAGSTFGRLSRGAFSGREVFLAYDANTNAGYTDDAASDEAASWVEITRFRNLSVTEGPSLNNVEQHGVDFVGAIPGYRSFSGSFEYVRSRAADPVYAYLRAARDNGDPVRLLMLDNSIATSGASGWIAPVLLGEGTFTANGNDPAVETFAFQHADVVDETGVQEVKQDVAVP